MNFRFRKPAALIAISVIFAGLLVMGLAPQQAGAGEKKRIAVFLPSVGIPYIQQKMYGYFTEAEKFGFEVKIFDAGGYANLYKQISQIEDAITVKYDGFIVMSVSMEGCNQVIEEAIKKGIPLVNEDVLSNSPMIKCKTSEDPHNVGRIQALYTAELLRGKGRILHFPGPPGAELFMKRAEGSLAYLTKFPGIKRIAGQHLGQDVAAYTKVMDDYLQSFPDMDAVLTNSGGSAASLGIANALQAAGKKLGEIPVINVDLDGETPRLLREGWITATVLCEPVELARTSVGLLNDMMEGKPVPVHVYTKEVLVTKNTIDAVDRSGDWIPDDWYETVRQYLK